MLSLSRKIKICFVGPFSVEELGDLILDKYFVCYFLENTQISYELLNKYDYVFDYDDHCGQVIFYCPDPIVIDVNNSNAECCVYTIMQLGNHGIAIDIADQISALYGGKNSFYCGVSIDDAKQIVVGKKHVSGIIFKVLAPEMPELNFGWDELEKAAEEIYELTCGNANIIFDLELKSVQKELACNLFVCESVKERAYTEWPENMDKLQIR